MHFIVAAFLKPGTEEELIRHSDGLNEQLGPSGENVLLAGALRDENGKKLGYLAIVEGETIGQARDWVHSSPIYRANLYERLEVFEYQNEVGRL